ncbi:MULTISPECIES: restriction endonuclease subunit S [Bacillus cereus group]|uniref:restriction endonuclease subunit S n=1 Tax=Bacillus cereus group TaxID=86661 RepID=UPI0002FCA6BE|nr:MULTISPECIES: restriction endonuclease subunit S [Bacillus cereus group]MBL3853021.1 restriction endonuclease subunit S [Bacillus cereus]SME52106.1 Type I restriction modification DNA specificity domain protein [Bacillus mobilis]
MKNNHTPDIRFPRFSGDWEQRKLKEIVERVTRKNTNLESTLPLTISAQYGLVDQVTFFNKQVASKDVSNYYLLKNGEFAYNKSYSNGYPWGAVKRLDRYNMGVLSTLYITFKPTLINSDFLVSYYDTTQWHKEVSMRAAEGARNHGLLNISASEFFDTNLKVPNKEEEQIKIGNFFKQLDDTIALHQQELDIIKQTKQGFLQKMFPNEGESVPEVRFPGYTGDWEQRKLGNHAEILTGGTPKTQIKEYWEPREIPWMSSGEVNKKRLSSTDNMISTQGFENSSARWVKENSVLIALAGQGKTRGTVAINEIPLTTNQSIAAIVPKDELHFEFIFQNLEKRYEELRLISSGDGTRGGLNKQLISDVEIMSPSVEEQIKIGNFFKQLDDTIALHQRELDALKETKKAFLQKMFV